MFNGYNDSTLISYEFNQEKEKKLDNVAKYPYGQDGGVQSTPTHPNNRQSDFWSGKPNFVGIPNIVKCNCTGCYPTTENQSYHVQSTRHRPWLPKTYSVPLNGSSESKLPAYQWDNALNQVYYSDSNVPYGQENGGKHSYYKQFQTPNQPGVIISANKQKSEMGYQNGVRQPVMCNPGYDLTKRVNGRSYYDGDKYSFGVHSVSQISRLPIEPYTKAVPSNLNQNRVPSTGHRKENSPQCDHYSNNKIFAENYHPGLSLMDLKNNGVHVDYSYFNRDPDFYRNNYTEVKRNNIAMQNRKDCSVTQGNLEQHYGRSKHPDNLKGCEMFYPNFDKNQMESCMQRVENDGMNRIPRSVMVCNDLLHADERPQVFPYENNAACRNYVRPEYPLFNSQLVPGFQETDQNQCRTLPQQMQSCDQQSQGNNGCIVDPQKINSEKTQSFGRTQLIVDAQPKPNYLETIRSEELTKNGTNKISPLRLLRKKKLVTAPQEVSSATSTSETSVLDVRKFWSTWAEEEDENVSPTQMVVLDCQNIDPEQAKLLNFYETDTSRPINLENVILKNPDWVKDNIENVKASEQPVDDQEKQVGIPTQIQPVSKNSDEIISELEAVKISPKKYRSQENRKKKVEEVMDKWTEKKFDFLKRSEESKAAEMIRYEEEKKKIFERRLSFQQMGANNIEKPQEDVLRLEENSPSNSPKERISDLPTSEYRRNKFLDYSEVIINGCKDSQKIENVVTNQSTKAAVKEEEPEAKQEAASPSEMCDILKKITEIDFEEMKLESGLEASNKGKKTKKKKSDQPETDARTDLKLESVAKPTIKFSIQKSHDLKISFKVLNKQYEEEVKSEETKPIEDANTEMITLKYKSIQNGSKLSELKKKKGKFRRNKHAPALKIKKSRYREEEQDFLADDDESKVYPADDFQVQETVDSAKIKLTFKRHKTNTETECKIDGEGREKNSKVFNNKYKKKSRKAKKRRIYTSSDIKSAQTEQKEQRSSVVGTSEGVYKDGLESTEEYAEKSSVSHLSCSTSKEETHENFTPSLGMTLPEKRLCELAVQTYVTEDSKFETDCGEQLDSFVGCHEASESNDKHKFSPDKNIEEVISESSEDGKTTEENQGISLDFIRTINSPDIETMRDTEKTEEIEGPDVNEGGNKNGATVIESTNENHSILESSYDLKKNLDFLEITPDWGPISLDERNANLKSDSHKSFDAEITEKGSRGQDVSAECQIESKNICGTGTNSEDNASSKLVENNFAGYDSIKEKNEDSEAELEEKVESETSKVVHNESKIELEDMFIKVVESGSSENHCECPEGKDKGEPGQVYLEFDKINYKEESCDSEVKPLLLKENIYQTQTVDRSILNGSSQNDSWVEPVVNNTEKGIHMENLEPFDSEGKLNPGFENRNVDLRKFESEESRTSVEDEKNVVDFVDDKEKTFLIESELDNCPRLEKEDKSYEGRAGKVHYSEFPCGRPTKSVESETIGSDDISNGKFETPGTERIRGSSFTEQGEPEYIDFDSHLINKDCYEHKTETEAVHFENENERPELIVVETMSESLDIDHLINIPNHINEEAVTEQKIKVICDSQNSPFTESQVRYPSQAGKYVKAKAESNGDDINEPEIEFDFSTCDNQSLEVTDQNQIEPKDCSLPKTQPTELTEAKHFTLTFFDSLQGTNDPGTCNQESNNFITRESPRIADPKEESNFKVLGHFEGDKGNREIDHGENPEEKNKESETVILSDKLISFLKPQEDTVVMENKNQTNFPAYTSLVDHSRVTDQTEINLNEETEFAINCLPQSQELDRCSLELPSSQESELEDGEIVDCSSDDSEFTEQTASFDFRKTFGFKIQKPVRRHSTYFCITSSSWCQRRFHKSKSCPPRFEVGSFDEYRFKDLVKNIPLPLGPPPLGSCYSFSQIIQEATVGEERKEKSEKILVGRVLEAKEKGTKQDLPCGSQFRTIELQSCRNPSPPRSDALGNCRSKIRFTLRKSSRFSTPCLQSQKLKVFEKLKYFEMPESKAAVPRENSEQAITKYAERSELEDVKSNEKPDFGIAELSEKSHPENTETEKIQENELPEEAEMETVDSFGKSKMEVMKPFGKPELKAVDTSETVGSEAIDPVENLELEVIESSINIETETGTDKIRTPDFVSVDEEIRECQIAEVPSIHPDDKDQKSDLEVESLCEDAHVEIIDVMNDFMREEFYEDIPTSEDLPNGDSVDEKVNDDKFRSIMQNCLENAKKFLNVGNLKLFSCSVDDLLELDNPEHEPAANHISRDVLLTSCEDTNDDLGLNEKFQPMDISMEFVPSDVCPEILPVDNWPYLEEEVPSSPLKSSETDLILENTISEIVPNRKRVAKESENYKRFRRKSLADEEEPLCTKIAAHRRKTIDGFNSFLSYTKVNRVDKPNETLKCRLSLEKLTENGMEFICSQSDYPEKVKGIQSKKQLNYKSPLWQPKVMLIRISENEMKRFKKAKSRSRSAENMDSLPAMKKTKSGHRNSKMENEVLLSIPQEESIKGQISISPDVKKPKPRFRNLHTKQKPEQAQSQPKAVETAMSELFKDPSEKNTKFERANKNAKITEPEPKSESKSDGRSSKYHFSKDKHDHRDRRRESDRERHKHKEKRKHERSKHDDGKRQRSSNTDDDRKRSLLKSDGGKREVRVKEVWVCEVCGFNDANERVSHIKNHPFHCQSCHLAFKTEVYFTDHLTEMHKDIRNQHHCLLCELSFDTEEEYQHHLETREHTHLEAVEKNTINTLFTLLTGAPCPVLGLVEMKPEWLPNQPGTVHFYHQATPLSLALQYLKMHGDLTSYPEASKLHPN